MRPVAFDVTDFSSRTAAASYQPYTAPAYAKVHGYSSAGDGGAALYKPVSSQPSHAGKFSMTLKGGTTKWYELAEAQVTPQMFGAKGDGVTDDWQAFVDAMAYGGGDVYVPAASYYLSKTLNIKRPVHLHGPANFLRGFVASLRFPTDVVGLFVHRADTNSDAAGIPSIGASTTGGDGAIITNLEIISNNGNMPSVTQDSAAHGIWLKARARLQNVRVAGFKGNGAHIVATASATTDADLYGNANHWQIDGLRSERNCGHGVFLDGADVNAGSGINVDCTGNGRWGLYEDSFLGNAYPSGLHFAANGMLGYCHYEGNRYYTINEALAGSTVPGTDATVWVPQGAGIVSSTYRQWAEGGYFREGGSFNLVNANARGVLVGVYCEEGQPPSRAMSPWLLLGGSNPDGYRADSTGVVLGPAVGELVANRPIKVSVSGSGDVKLGAGPGGMRSGMGSPEGVVSAGLGTLYLRRDGGVGTTLYVKETSSGATGWSAK